MCWDSHAITLYRAVSGRKVHDEEPPRRAGGCYTHKGTKAPQAVREAGGTHAPEKPASLSTGIEYIKTLADTSAVVALPLYRYTVIIFGLTEATFTFILRSIKTVSLSYSS